MKLITFQPESILRELAVHEHWECDPKYIDVPRYGHVYDWVAAHMEKNLGKPAGIQYPIWCWVKFKSGICPPRHKGKSSSLPILKITFNKRAEDVFVTDYRRYSFLLNYRYIPESLEDRRRFDEKLASMGLASDAPYVLYQKFPEICGEIENSFQRCITSDSDVLQGCVWRVSLSDIERIEFLRDPGYQYGTFNYVRQNGSRFNWIEDFYKKLS